MFRLESQVGAAVFRSETMLLRVGFVAPGTVRVTCSDGRPLEQRPSRIVSGDRSWRAFELHQEPGSFVLKTSELTVMIDRYSGALSYYNCAGKILLREPQRGGKWLTAKEIYRNVFCADAKIDYSQSIDGVRARPGDYQTMFDRTAFEAKLEFEFSEEEALFGFGSHEEGYGNLRGRSRELYQQNMKAVVPYFVSTRGYGVLFDCGSLMTFHDDALGSYWWADVVDELDFYVIAGEGFDDVTRGYYNLTGSPPMLPKWAFGYVQSKERYVNAQELVDVVREYRRRQIPLDTIVLDWKSWPNGGGWGQKSFDPARFPEPRKLTEELHALGAHLMVSIWPIMTGGCPDQRELMARGLMFGNQSTYDAFSAEARECYWQQARSGLFDQGVDAWWCDCTEPFEADWSGAVKPEPHERLRLNTAESKLYIDPAEINAYSLVHSRGIYDGQRRTTDRKRVLNLTRSSYAGQHRYATVTWNGDTCGTWETLHRTIPEGLNFCATGEPYWTVDIGGFFIANEPELWFWSGDYAEGCRGLTAMNAVEPDPNDTGCRDLGFWELYTRWLQYAAFLPMFRSHGTDAAREIWRFGDEGTMFYDAIAHTIRLRYELMPYIYSLAAAITFQGTAMMRAVALDFPDDPGTFNLIDQYLFGPALLVCPVTRPMYFTSGSQLVSSVEKSRDVYLPAGAQWFNFWTSELHEGAQQITAMATLERIPVFVRAGSIVPMAPVMQYVDEFPGAPFELRVYTGANACFALYEDSGDSYAYERGEYAFVELEWNDLAGELILHARRGGFPEMARVREFRIVILAAAGRREQHAVFYSGEEIRVHSPHL